MIRPRMLFVRRTRRPAGFGAWIWQAHLRCDDGQLDCTRSVALENDVTNTSAPQTRKQIISRACNHYKSLRLFDVRNEVFESASIDHDHSIDPHVRLVD